MSGPPAASAAPQVGSILGRHTLVRVLGEGGMGIVFEGTHQDLGRRAAVKTLHARFATSEDVRARFLREGQAASRVRHPNVVNVYDVGVDNEQPFLVMELLEGEELSRRLARDGALTPEQAADLLLPVVAAVAAAHDLGVVHRDLKPDNVFLCLERGSVTPKVLDFGISKIVDRDQVEPLTSTGAFLGTPHYISPEQAQGAKHIDARSDQYSLGVVLYQAVTGRKPVEEPSLYPLIQRIVHGQFPAPRRLNPDVPPEFEAVILKAMAREPAGRFASTRELGAALLPFASERVRALHGPELLDARMPPPVVIPATTGEVRGDATTLSDSVQQRDLPRAPVVPRRGAWLAIVGGLAAVALTFGALRDRSRPVAQAAPVGSLAEGQPAALAPAPAAPEAQAVSAVASTVTPPTSASAPTTKLVGKVAPPRSVPREARPVLAPR